MGRLREVRECLRSRTIAAPPRRVWDFLVSAEGIDLITSDPDVDLASLPVAPGRDSFESLESLEGQSPTGIRIATTTFEPGSHVRMRWQRPRWQAHSILQIRVIPKSETKTILSFHQEKLPTRDDREELRDHWRRIAEAIAEHSATRDSAGG